MKVSKIYKTAFNFFILMIVLFSCKDNHPIPSNIKDIWIYNIELDPQFSSLQTTYMPVFVTGGFKGNGVIIVRQKYDGYTDDFLAFDRTCPYEADACIVRFDESKMNLECECCETEFYVGDGYPISGPSKFPLRQYKCDFIDGNLHIY